MKDFKGKISIGGLRNINNLEDAKRVNLRNKCKLEILELCWKDHFDIFDYEDSKLELDLVPEACEDGIVGVDDVHFSLLECLQPHPNLKALRVRDYPSAIVPGWMRDSFLLQSIEELRFSRGYIESLPFGNHHTLKHLYIEECSSVQTIQLEQLSSQLETLYIERCDHLELIIGLGYLNMLKELKILYCKTLKSLTMDGLQLVESTKPFSDSSHERPHINRQSISSLTMLEIRHCRSLDSLQAGLIPFEPCYVRVYHCGCPDVEIGNSNWTFTTEL